MIAGTANQIREKTDNGIIDIGMLPEPADLTVDEVKKSLRLSERAEMIRDAGEMLCTPLQKLNVAAAHNSISNAAFLVEKGLGYALTIEASVLNYDQGRFSFVPIYPEMYANSVLIWKKAGVFTPTVRKFLMGRWQRMQK